MLLALHCAVAQRNQACLFLTPADGRLALAVGQRHPAGVQSQFLRPQNQFFAVIAQRF